MALLAKFVSVVEFCVAYRTPLILMFNTFTS